MATKVMCQKQLDIYTYLILKNLHDREYVNQCKLQGCWWFPTFKGLIP